MATSVADAVPVNTNGIKTLLVNGWSTFFIIGPRNLPRSPTYCTILETWVFGNFILADEFLAKALRRYMIWLVSNILCANIAFSLLQSAIIFDDSLSSLIFVVEFNPLVVSLITTLLYWIILY